MVAFVYIVSGPRGGLHVDVTLSLMRAMWGCRTGDAGDTGTPAHPGKLVYFERCNNICDAYARRRELSGQGREQLGGLVERRNPNWEDLSAALFPAAAHRSPMPTMAVVSDGSRKPVAR